MSNKYKELPYFYYKKRPENLISKTQGKHLGLRLKERAKPKATSVDIFGNKCFLYDKRKDFVPRPEPTEAQKRAAEHAREFIGMRKCKKCGERHYTDTFIADMCRFCYMDGARNNAVNIANKILRNKRVIVIDTETTGLLTYHSCRSLERSDSIIEIAVVEIENRTPRLLYESLVKSSTPISPRAQEVHGIKEEDLIDAPDWSMVWRDIHSYLRGSVVCSYNYSFDSEMIITTCLLNNTPIQTILPKLGIENHCLMKLAAQFYGDYNYDFESFRWQKLSTMCAFFGIKGTYHRAKGDALAAAQVLIKIADDSDAAEDFSEFLFFERMLETTSS